jgi:hypothetical protein
MRRRSLSTSRAHGVGGVGGVVQRTVLRSDHPLLRATEAVDYTGRQWVHVVAVLTGSAIARIEGRESARPLAAIVLLILTVLLAAHKQRERDYAIELVLEGLETVSIAAVQRQRRRLLSDRTRNGLAGNLEELIRQAAGRSRLHVRVTPLPFGPMVSTMAAGERRDVIGLVRTQGVSAHALREELRRVRDLLENGGM